MLGLDLVRPLEDDWRDTIDRVATARGWPTSREPARLARCVEALSAAYNDPLRARAGVREAGAARLGFAFPRDVPKGAGAVRELVATGLVRLSEAAPLRLLDLGAGLGAATWGVVRALEASGASGRVEATWVDADAQALEVAAAIARERLAGAPSRVVLRARTVARRATDRLDDLGRYDLVLVGQLLSELDVGAGDESRAARQGDLLAAWLAERTDEAGALVVIEPALRDRTRSLHRVRDLLARRPGVTIFAPCLHAAPCPSLQREGDWCHEDLPVDLPPWLVPVVRAAGLRREGLTFSYLVARRDGQRLADLIEEGAPPLRVVSSLMRSKGKAEAYVCGELSGPHAAVRAKAMRLDRDAGPGNEAWGELTRGEVIRVAPPLRGSEAGQAGAGALRIGAVRVLGLRPHSAETR